MSIVYIQISNTYLPEFLNILLYIEANPVWMCRKCLYWAVIFTDWKRNFPKDIDKKIYFMNVLWSTSCLDCILKEGTAVCPKARLHSSRQIPKG